MEKFKGTIEYRKSGLGVVAVVAISPGVRIPDQGQWKIAYSTNGKTVYEQTFSSSEDAREGAENFINAFREHIEAIRAIELPEDQSFEI